MALNLGGVRSNAAKVLSHPVAAMPTRIEFTCPMGDDSDSPAVWVVNPDSRAVSIRNVDILRYDQAAVAVSGGLDAGEIVVTAGVQALHPGQVVRLLGSEP